MKRLFMLGFAILIGTQLYALGASAAANDFTISDFKVEYYLSKDADGRSLLKTVESIKADFPSTNQSHGIERAIPKKYDGHTTHLDVLSVKNEKGTPLAYDTYGANGNLVLRVGDEDTYVHGTQTYVLTYAQTDVTRSFQDTNDDEFYWNTNGTDWKVPIQNLTVRLHVDETVAESLTKKASCYQGVQGATSTCVLTKTGTTYEASATRLHAGENVTIAIGFKPHTFAGFVPTKTDVFMRYWVTAVIATSIASIVALVWLSIWWYRLSDRRKEWDPIVPEYIPPKGFSVMTSGNILGITYGATTAQLLDFAVRHYVKIYEMKPKGWLKMTDYEIEIIRDTGDLRAEEKEILFDMFGTLAVGSRLSMKKMSMDASVAKRTSDDAAKLKKLVRGEYALREKNKAASKKFTRTGIVFTVLAVVLLSPGFLVVAIVAYIGAATLWPLTDKGLGLVRYLKGLKLYIKVAETERLKMLQSPEGAEKVSVDTNDQVQLVTLYERVLPYAVLFGQEREWNKRIGAFYETAGTYPEWYVGYGAFNAAAFSSSMTSFVTTSNYSPASSSAAGGSSGGGFSGGGGGGGGGGGW